MADTRAKDPAAVALGKKRQAAMTWRRWSKWLAPQTKSKNREVDIERPATAAELARLEGVIDRLSDEELERIASSLAGRL